MLIIYTPDLTCKQLQS